MDVSVVLGFLVAVFLVSVVPGPDMLFIVANAAAGGRRTGVVAAAGMSTGLAVHSVAAALGLGALIQAAPQVLNGVRVAGAAFLLYLAYLTWRASRQEFGTPEDAPQLPRRDRVRAPRTVAAGFLDRHPGARGAASIGPEKPHLTNRTG